MHRGGHGGLHGGSGGISAGLVVSGVLLLPEESGQRLTVGTDKNFFHSLGSLMVSASVSVFGMCV